MEEVAAWLVRIGMLKQTDESEDTDGGQNETRMETMDLACCVGV